MKPLVMILVYFLSINFSYAEFIGTTDEEIAETSKYYMENLINNFNAGNYEEHMKDFDERSKARLTKKKFKRERKRLDKKGGMVTNLEYLGFLNQRHLTVVLYKANYSKNKDDGIIKIYLNKIDDKISVAGLVFG